MKKVFRLAAIAIVAMAMATACNGKGNEENADTIDSMMDTVAVDTTAVDSMATDTVAAPVEEATPAKKATKTTAKKSNTPKAEVTIDPTNTKKSADGLTIKSGESQLNVKKGGKVSVDTKNIKADSKSGTITIKK